MKNIAVFTGGYSSEAPISRKSAATICDILTKHSFNYYLIDVDKAHWTVKNKDKSGHYIMNDGQLIFDNTAVKIDFAYIIIHGKPGENGQIQGYLDLHNIAYQTGDHFNMALSFSKKNTTAFLQSLGVKVAKSAYGHNQQELVDGIKKFDLKFPLFVKPDDAGSSFGVSKVKGEGELQLALEAAFKESNSVMAEEMIVGREFTCGVFEDEDGTKALPVTEIISHNEFFDYAAKYEYQSDEVTPAEINDATTKAIQDCAVKVYKLLACKGICRVDFICKENEEPVVIEINTIPGLTKESIIPQMFKVSPYNFEENILAMMK